MANNDIQKAKIKKDAKRIAQAIAGTSQDDRAFLLGLVALNLNDAGDPLGQLFARIASTYKARME